MGCGSSLRPVTQDFPDGAALDEDEGELSLGGRWLYEESPGCWALFSPEINAQLLVAWYCGETTMEYALDADTYLVDLSAATQTNLATGEKQNIGWGTAESANDDVEPAWIDYTDDQQDLLDAWAAGKEIVRYLGPDGCEYEVDFTRMISTNLSIGQQQDIAVEPLDGDEGGDVAPDEPPVEIEEWIECLDAKTGNFYYTKGADTTWERPSGPGVRIRAGHVHDGVTPAPPAKQVWKEYEDPKSGKSYYSNGRRTTWTKPTGEGVVITPSVSADTAKKQSEHNDVQTGAKAESAQCQPEQPQTWTEIMDIKTGRTYYSDGVRTVWDRPVGAGITIVPDPATCHQKKFSLGPDRQAAPRTSNEPQTKVPPVPDPTGSAGVTAGSHFARKDFANVRAKEQHQYTSRQQQPGADSTAQKERPSYGQRHASNAAKGKAGARPKAKAFKASPAGGKGPKKWTLGPERQAPPAPGGDWQQYEQQPRGDRANYGPGQGVGGGKAEQSRGPKLPEGISWPSDPKAKAVVEALYKDMAKSLKAPLKERQKAYRAACLSWHPDKNPKHQLLATTVFQFLQSLKKWYLPDVA